MEYVTTNGEQERGEIRRPKAEQKDTMNFYHEIFVLNIEGIDENYRYAQELGGNIETLREMIKSPRMEIFAPACRVLGELGTEEAYEVLKECLGIRDKHLYRYLMSVIFRFPQSAELADRFVEALESKDPIFVDTALKHLVRENLWVTEEQILSCFEKNRDQLHNYYYATVLIKLSKTEDHTNRILRMFHRTQNNSVKIALGECLTAFATEDNYMTLYDLMKDSPIHKLRMEACRIAQKFHRKELLKPFTEDPDGHIRSFVRRSLAENQI